MRSAFGPILYCCSQEVEARALKQGILLLPMVVCLNLTNQQSDHIAPEWAGAGYTHTAYKRHSLLELCSEALLLDEISFLSELLRAPDTTKANWILQYTSVATAQMTEVYALLLGTWCERALCASVLHGGRDVCHVVLHVVFVCCGWMCCAVLWCAVLCCAVLCCPVVCCAVLCCAVLCCAVLCCAVL